MVAFFGVALGLILSEAYMLWAGFPVALAASGLVAGLAAKWVGDLLSPDRSRGRLFPIALGAALVGLAAGYLLSALVVALRPLTTAPLAAFALPAFLGVPFAAVAFATKMRDPRRALRRDALWTILLALAVPALFAAAVAMGCALSMCGA